MSTQSLADTFFHRAPAHDPEVFLGLHAKMNHERSMSSREFNEFARWLSTSARLAETPFNAGTAWMAATFVILGFLTAMLIVSIAITV